MATKNVEPYTLSAILNEASLYSPAWSRVKYSPSITVSDRAWIVLFRLFSIRL